MPIVPADVEVAAFPQRPQDRLRLALRRLDAAAGEQAEAVAALRRAVGELSHCMAGLGGRMAAYRSALDGTAAELDRALAAAQRLHETAAHLPG